MRDVFAFGSHHRKRFIRHHLVHKVGAASLTPNGLKANTSSAGLLEHFGIETVVDKVVAKKILAMEGTYASQGGVLHNLCIAPFEYVHGDSFVLSMNKEIAKRLNLAGLGSAMTTSGGIASLKSGVNLTAQQMAAGKDAIVTALAFARNELQNGRLLP